MNQTYVHVYLFVYTKRNQVMMPYSNLLLTSVSKNYSLFFHAFVHKFPYSLLDIY